MAYADPEVGRAADPERFRRRAEELRAAGLCPRCGERPPAAGLSLCEPCNEKRNRASRARDARLRASGQPRRDSAKARSYERKRSRQEAVERRASGLCTRCGKAPAVESRTACEPCLEKRREADRARYAAGKAAGKPYGGANADAKRRSGRAKSRRRQQARRAAGLSASSEWSVIMTVSRSAPSNSGSPMGVVDRRTVVTSGKTRKDLPVRRTDRPVSRDKQSPGADAPGGTPRLALPAGLGRSLGYLDDSQLDELMRAVSAEARRRGWQLVEVGPDNAKKAGGRVPRSKTGSGKRSVPLTVGQENLIRAASEAGLGAAAIAREFRLSRAQVESVIRAARRRG